MSSQDSPQTSLEMRLAQLEAELADTRRELETVSSRCGQYALLLDNLPLYFVILGPDRTIRRVSDKLLQHLGMQPGEALGNTTGGLFKCYNDVESLKGGGYGESCLGCRLRKIIEEGFATGRSYDRIEVTIESTDSPLGGSIFLVSSTRVEIKGEAHILLYFDDINEKKRAELALRASKERYQMLFDHLPLMIHVIDLDGYLLEVNEQWTATLGYSRDEVVGHMAKEFLVPDSKDYLVSQLCPVFRNRGEVYREPLSFTTKLGQTVETRFTARLGQLKGADSPYVLCACENVSDQTAVQRALAESREKYRYLFDHTPICIFHCDADGDITDVNEQFCRTFEINRDQIVGRNAYLMARNHLLRESIRNGMEEGYGHYRGEYRTKFSNKIHFLDIAILRTHDSKGQVIGGIGIIEDVTQAQNNADLIRLQRDMGVSFASTDNLDKTAEIGLDAVVKVAREDCGSIYLRDLRSNDFHCTVHKGVSGAVLAQTNPLVLATCKERLLEDRETVVLTGDEVLPPVEGLCSITLVPVVYEEQCLAVFVVYSMVFERLPEFAVSALESLSGQVALALVKARIHEDLVQSERNLNTLFASLEEFLFVVDVSGMIIGHNPIVEQKLGYTSAELRTMSVLDLHSVERREEAGQVVARMLAGEEMYCHIPIMKKDGSLIPVETKVTHGIWNDEKVIFGISRDVSQRVEAEAARKVSEERLQAAIEAIDEGFVIYDHEDRLVMCNAKYREIYNTSKDLLVPGRRFEDVLTEGVKRGQYPAAAGREDEWMQDRLADHKECTRSIEQRLEDGRWLKISEKKMQDGSVVGFRVDITNIKKTEERIRAALKEKETLLREIHHRVKNNMQVVTSLLSLQAVKFDDPKVLSVFHEAEGRVLSMALVHEILYTSENLSEISVQDYLTQLTRQLWQVFSGEAHLVQLVVQAEGVYWGVDHAIPCGLVVTELITNAFKYAFPEGRGGTVEIRASHPEEGKTRLVIADNGVGLPADYESASIHTLGLRLVRGLVEEQLEGTLTIDLSAGTRCVIEWPCST